MWEATKQQTWEILEFNWLPLVPWDVACVSHSRLRHSLPGTPGLLERNRAGGAPPRRILERELANNLCTTRPCSPNLLSHIQNTRWWQIEKKHQKSLQRNTWVETDLRQILIYPTPRRNVETQIKNIHNTPQNTRSCIWWMTTRWCNHVNYVPSQKYTEKHTRLYSSHQTSYKALGKIMHVSMGRSTNDRANSFERKYCYYALHVLDEIKMIHLQTSDYGVSLGTTQFVLYKLLATKTDAGWQPWALLHTLCPNGVQLNWTVL